MATRLKIGSKIYTVVGSDEISLRDCLVFAGQAAAMGLNYTWQDVERIVEDLRDLDEDEIGRHPESAIMTAITIWLTRRAAGEDVTLEEAVSIRLSDFDFLPDPTDHKPAKKAKAAKKTTKKSPPPSTVSAPVDDVDEAQPTT